MLQGLSPYAQAARAWPFEQARNLMARLLKTRLESHEERLAAAELIKEGKFDELVARYPSMARPVVFETGYGPSGLPHIGTFNEVVRTTMVRTAFRAQTEDLIPTRLICFSDDMDGLRKAPDNVPNHGLLLQDLGKPLTVVRDPFGEHESFGAHNNARLQAFLDGYGFDYEFMSSTEQYRTGAFDEKLLLALERFDDIQKVMLPTLGPERRATYSCFLPISPTTGRVLQVPTLERNVAAGTIVFEDEDGSRVEQRVTGGLVKMQWKPDWAMRWAALGVDYEMSGKDLIESVKVSSQICRVLGGHPPEGFNYELFLDEQGQKISKTKGNGLSMEEWLRYGPQQTLAYYIFPNPKSAKTLHFDVIPRAVDDYLKHLDAYNAETDVAKRLENPVWHVHTAHPPAKGSPVPFNLLVNLVSAGNASSRDVLWGFLTHYSPGASPESEPLLDQLVDYVIAYYEDFVKPTKSFRLPTDKEREALRDLAARLKMLPPDCKDGGVIQDEVYAVGNAHGFDPLRAWFAALYEVLLGSSQGPRFGSFAAIFGLGRTIDLIERGARGELAAA
ncbi:MAG: lysine--tRNA ligase [Caulobacteraceae bacterium]|nr:lysine--tRNA ligase [Caulobacteraceae bacterium]